MSRRYAKEEDIKTLAEWVARWPKAKNLGFDKETREPTIFSNEGTKVSSIPWKRAADTLTVLAQPHRFSPQTVESAKNRFATFRVQKDTTHDADIRNAETALLDAWRAYHANPVKDRRPVLTAERTLFDLEHMTAPQSEGRVFNDKLYRGTSVYVPPMKYGERGIPIDG